LEVRILAERFNEVVRLRIQEKENPNRTLEISAAPEMGHPDEKNALEAIEILENTFKKQLLRSYSRNTPEGSRTDLLVFPL